MSKLLDTNGSALVQALITERRAAGAVAAGLALTLIAVTDEERCSEVTGAAGVAAAMHPLRLLVVVRHDVHADSRLDAEVQIGGRMGAGEAIVMHLYGRLALHAESLVLPLLAPDTPVVTWWHMAPPNQIAHDPLGVLAGRRITDSALAADPLAALRNRASDYHPGDTDLAWTRATGWRGLLASAMESVGGKPVRAEVTAEKNNPSGMILAGWLKTRLSIPVKNVNSAGPGITEVRLSLQGGEFRDGPRGIGDIVLGRKDGRTATLAGGRMTERTMPLPRRDLGDLLVEELHRLDADEPFGRALEACTRSRNLEDRSPFRHHVWFDPAQHRGKGDGEPSLFVVGSRRRAGASPRPAKAAGEASTSEQMARSGRPGAAGASTPKAVKKTTAKKTTAKKTAVKRTGVKKAAAKKTSAQRTSAR